MSLNPLNDISKVYLEQVAESAVPGKPAERLGAVTAIPKSEQDAARERLLAKAKAKREKMKEENEIEEAVRGADSGMRRAASVERRSGDKRLSPSTGRGYADQQQQSISYMDKLTKKNKNVVGLVTKEALDPVGQEDADIDNDGDSDKTDKYLHNRRKAIGKAIAKKRGKNVKEGFSNWRQDLAEVMSDEIDTKPIKEKKVNNKVKINPNLSEAVEEIGGTLIEMVEVVDFEGVLGDLSESEIFFLNDSLIEQVVEEFFFECLDDGYDLDEVQDSLIESLEISSAMLVEAKVTLGHDTKIKSDRLEKVKSAVKKVGGAVARGAGYAAGATVRGARAVGREFKKGYERGRGGSSSDSGTQSSSSGSSSSSSGSEKRPGLLSRIGSKLKSGLKKAVASGARAVSRGARNVARKMEGGETKKAEAPKAAPKKAEKPSDPWGEPTTPPKQKPKAATKKAAAQKAKAPAAKPAPKRKRKSKLDDLLASVRNEEVQIDEKTLTKMEMKKREEIVKSMKDNASDFEKRYPGRGKEVMYATATKMAKKMAEQMMPEPPVDTDSAIDKKKEMMDKQKLANMKMLQQKQQMLQKQRLQMQKSGKLPLEAD